MRLLKEFKEFAVKGNVVDLATAVIIGGAFGKIVSSLVGDVIMPLLGLLIGGTDFNSWNWAIKQAVVAADGSILKPAITIGLGTFFKNIVDFLIIAASVFLMIKVLLNVKAKLKPAEAITEAKEPELTPDQKLLTEIRDLLKK